MYIYMYIYIYIHTNIVAISIQIEAWFFSSTEGLILNTADVFFIGCMHKYPGNTQECIEDTFNHLTLFNDYQFYLCNRPNINILK